MDGKVASTSPTNNGSKMKSPRAQKRSSIPLRFPGLNVHREHNTSMSSLNPTKFDDLIGTDFALGFQVSAASLGDITAKAASILEAQSCHVWLIDDTNQNLYTLVQGAAGGEEVRLTKPLDRGIASSVILKPSASNTTTVGTSDSSRWSHNAPVDEKVMNTTTTTSYLAWPLWESAGGDCIGMVEFRNKLDGEESFDEADSQLARIVAIQLANAIVHYRQKTLIAGRNEAINKAYEEMSYDANERICIDSAGREDSAHPPGWSCSPTSSHDRSNGTETVHASTSQHDTYEYGIDRQSQRQLSERGWDYNTFLHTEEELIQHAIDIFDERGLLTRYSIPVSILTNFLREIIKGYQSEAPYHNQYHCFDVLHVSYLLITRCKADEYLESLNILSIFIAALAHDLGHDGYNNAFHMATESELAICYNGVSILENNSAAQLFRILKKEGCNILARLSKAEATKMKSRLIDLILDTDAKVSRSSVCLWWKYHSRNHINNMSNILQSVLVQRIISCSVQDSSMDLK